MIDYTRLTIHRIDGLWSVLAIRSAEGILPESLCGSVLTDEPTAGSLLTLGQAKALFHARATDDVHICVDARRRPGLTELWHLTKHKDTIGWREHLGREPLCFDDFATILANGVVWLSRDTKND